MVGGPFICEGKKQYEVEHANKVLGDSRIVQFQS